MFNYLLAAANTEAAKNLQLTSDHLLFWRQVREYMVGGDAVGSNLIAKALSAPVSLIFWFGIGGTVMAIIWNTGYKHLNPFDILLDSLPQIAWVLLVSFLLANNFAYAYKFSNASWLIRLRARETISSITLANTQLSSAIVDQVYYSRFGQEVSGQLKTCNAKPFPAVYLPSETRPAEDPSNPLSQQQVQAYDALDCYKSAGEFAERTYLALEKECGGSTSECDQTTARAKSTATKIKEKLGEVYDFVTVDVNGVPLPDLLALQPQFKIISDSIGGAVAAVGDFAYMNLVELGNTGFTGFIELSFALAGLFFPGVVSWSMLPGKKMAILDWLIFAISIMVMETSYVLMVGITAVMAEQPQFDYYGARLFLYTLGIIGPFLAFSLGAYSGWTMARTARGIGLGGARAGLQIASAGAFTTLHRLNHRRSLRRR